MKMCSVFLRDAFVYVHADSQTVQGAWIASAPFLRVEWIGPDSAASLEKGIATVLEASEQGIPHPSEWTALAPLYRLAGVDSWSEFTAGDCKLVRIEADADAMRLQPQANRNPKGGFVDVGEPLVCMPPKAMPWKTLLEAAFSKCQ
ncbi:MAG TPA: hypothetical protein VMY42_21905 [Thermoguttaceae bacterium]|nr:hypothetical protein [Thermoguttaceae bacterium]